MSKKFLSVDLETGKKKLETAIVEKTYEGGKDEVAYSATAVDSLLSEVDGNVTLTDEFRVTGVTVGNLTDGTTIEAGTSVLELLQKMLQKQIPPTYSSPTLSISGGQTVESGTNVKPVINPNYTKKDGGDVTKYVLKKNGVNILDVDSLQSYTEQVDIQIGDGTSTYFEATATYSDGPIKNDNFNKPYPTGSIKAGSVNSNRVNYVGQRKRFWTTDSEETIPSNSDEIRAFKNSAMNPSNGTQFDVIIPAGGRRAVFAYPATLRDVTSVKYVELGNGEVKDTFTKYIIQVAGANGYNPIDYKVYVYVSAVPAAGQMTYKVTI